MATRHERAKPLPPDDRRKAIIKAVTPLLLTKGSAVTSREMAEAAGIAEGTIFRVFKDKASVIIDAIKAGMDPAPVQDALAGIPAVLSMESQLEEATRELLEWSDRVATLFGVLRTVHTSTGDRPCGGRRFFTESNAAILSALTDLFERHRERLTVTPSRAAVAFRGFVFASAHPMSDEKLTPAEIVGMLLAGIAMPGGDGPA